MEPCILYQADDSNVTLLDIPRSIELAQGESGESNKRIISSIPLDHPYPSVEPKSAKAKSRLGEVLIEDLLLQKHLQLALESLKESYDGIWCLPRVAEKLEIQKSGKKRKMMERVTDDGAEDDRQNTRSVAVQQDEAFGLPLLLHNPKSTSRCTTTTPDGLRTRLPPLSTALQGDMASTLQTFTQSAPLFNLIIMDPPWPNRSARRKSLYSISYSTIEIQALLSTIPVFDHLAEDGLVAVWVTNKPAFRDLLLREEGLFDEWGIDLVEEWVWVKVTANGEMICALDSVWRKPYEILLVGRKKGVGRTESKEVRRKVVVAVPELHSRKPNLKGLFEKMIGTRYEALEVFARNLTAGWWAWGNEVLEFQRDEHWINDPNP